MSLELGASLVPPISVSALIGIMLWLRKERVEREDRLEKALKETIEDKADALNARLDDFAEYIAVSSKLERELSERLARIEGHLDQKPRR